MSVYNSMQNNPISYADPDGDWVVHAGAAVLGAGYNIYNNWSSVVKNPWSAIGYGATGAVAGAVSVNAPGAAKLILAGGNIATDFAFGNVPDINEVGDILNYGGKVAMDAVAVGGTGAMAKTIKSTIKHVGTDAAFEGLAALTAEKKVALLQEYTTKGMSQVDALTEIANMNFAGSINIVASRTYTAGIGSSMGAGIVSQAIHGNSVNNPNPSQVYHHTFSDVNGNLKTYTGIGDINGERAWKSVKRIEKQNPGWSFYDSQTTISSNRKTALMTEQVMINQSRRVNGANSVFNKKNTGKRLLQTLNKIF